MSRVRARTWFPGARLRPSLRTLAAPPGLFLAASPACGRGGTYDVKRVSASGFLDGIRAHPLHPTIFRPGANPGATPIDLPRPVGTWGEVDGPRREAEISPCAGRWGDRGSTPGGVSAGASPGRSGRRAVPGRDPGAGTWGCRSGVQTLGATWGRSTWGEILGVSGVVLTLVRERRLGP